MSDIQLRKQHTASPVRVALTGGTSSVRGDACARSSFISSAPKLLLGARVVPELNAELAERLQEGAATDQCAHRRVPIGVRQQHTMQLGSVLGRAWHRTEIGDAYERLEPHSQRSSRMQRLEARLAQHFKVSRRQLAQRQGVYITMELLSSPSRPALSLRRRRERQASIAER